MLSEIDIWKLLAGLGIFMFGMFLMEESIKKLSGRAFKRLIREYTTGKIKSILSGTFVTSILQSSSAVSLIILAFVGAGLVTMENAIGVILGTNMGSTITSWIVATIGFKVNIESFALPLIGAGGLGIIFLGKSEKYSNISKLLVGFGFLFMGLEYMKVSMDYMATSFDINTLPDYNIIVYLGIGFFLTAVMQSSSATIAIVLTALNAKLISFNSAAVLVIGANVGTTVTILLGTIKATQIKKRVAYSHFAFNIVTGILALLLMPLLVYIVLHVFNTQDNLLIALALFHTLFNLIGILFFYPFIHIFSTFLNKVFPDIKAAYTLFINKTSPDVPEAAITALKQETLHLIKMVLRHNLSVLNIDETLIFSENNYSQLVKTQLPKITEDRYEKIKLLQANIFTFASGIQEHELTEEEVGNMRRYSHSARMALHSAKTLKDIEHDFIAFESADNFFLNSQYNEFKKRLIKSYLRIDKIIETDKDKTKAILKTLELLKKDDKHFISLATEAINNQQIKPIDVSTSLLVNRAFIQSTRQMLLALRELLLSPEEIVLFERVQDISDTLIEHE